MSEQPAGWYPDPYAALPGTERWWDGTQWIAQTRLPAAQRQPVVDSGWAAATARPASADGTVLASWGARLGAFLLDIVPVSVVLTVFVMTTDYPALMQQAALGDEAAMEELLVYFTAANPVFWGLFTASVLVTMLYNVGFHVWRGQTLGKMIVGIRVRQVAQSRPPTLGQALLRWFVQSGVQQLLGLLLPVLAFLGSLFSIVNHLWPLWDRQRQALHDKAARTIVVRSR